MLSKQTRNQTMKLIQNISRFKPVEVLNCLILLSILRLNQTMLVQSTGIEPNQLGANIEDPLIMDRSSTSSDNYANQLVDACQSKMQVITPYYATNSKGKLRTVVNSKQMQQAIQVETCIRSPINAAKCNAQLDCGCEQKYKWHRLLVFDPRDTNSSQGLFMDWFLFPSNCVCRCRPLSAARQLLRAIKKTFD